MQKKDDSLKKREDPLKTRADILLRLSLVALILTGLILMIVAASTLIGWAGKAGHLFLFLFPLSIFDCAVFAISMACRYFYVSSFQDLKSKVKDFQI